MGVCVCGRSVFRGDRVCEMCEGEESVVRRECVTKIISNLLVHTSSVVIELEHEGV